MSQRHLTRDDRISLGALLKAELSIRKCAKQLGFSPPGIKQEIDNNGGRDNYNPYKAHKRYLRLRKEANQCHRILGEDEFITELVVMLLGFKWSPEQIAGRIEAELKEKLISVASIYNYANNNRELSKLLARKHNKYRRTKAGNDRKRAREEESTKKSINDRPSVINKRKRVEDYEGDTIIGQERTARILTHVERKYGFLLADMLYDVTAEKISLKTVKAFEQIPDNKKFSITYDRGCEFAYYEITEKKTKLDIYHANPYHSWERGTNENTNGLIRRYYPKGTPFANIEEEELKDVVEQINHRPRKRLGYKSPYEKFRGVNFRILM
ncbi:MAG: IS30 family transposase [bacterium]